MTPRGAAEESGLRENCTSRLSERTEAGRPSPTSSDSTVGARESRVQGEVEQVIG